LNLKIHNGKERKRKERRKIKKIIIKTKNEMKLVVVLCACNEMTGLLTAIFCYHAGAY